MEEGRLSTALAGGFLDRLRRMWRDAASNIGGTPTAAAGSTEELRAAMRDCLDGAGGEVSARARAAQLGQTYLSLEAEGRGRFLRLLADEFGADREGIRNAIARFNDAKNEAALLSGEEALRDALESPRMRLLTQFNALPEGIKFLVDLRAEMLTRTRGDAAMAAAETELRELLFAWFDIGFLELQRVTWRSPALLLEKITGYEAVHAIRSWVDLKNRLDSDRRLYAFFHPRMPDEPVIFVEVALVNGLAGSIQNLLDVSAPLGDPARADTAIFYSINSAQRGLVGMNFGGFLIKRVASDLSREFPNIRTFATLSPIPGFRAWMEARLNAGEALPQADEKQVLAAAKALNVQGAGLAKLVSLPWTENPAARDALKEPLLRLAARYLLSLSEGRPRAADPVAHFHYSNGARFERLNWLADTSEKGLAQSCGMMANYLYRLSEVEANHEAYHGAGRIASSAAVRSLAKG